MLKALKRRTVPGCDVCRGLPACVLQGGPQAASCRARWMAENEPSHVAVIQELSSQVQGCLAQCICLAQVPCVPAMSLGHSEISSL